MIVIGIDPGYDRMGIAVIEKNNNQETLLFSDCFTSQNKDSLGIRLLAIGNKLEKAFVDWRADMIAVEKLYFTVNQKTAMSVAEARGIVSYLSAKHGIALFEYTPGEIKMAVTGYGNANKKQIAEMIPRLIKVNKKINFDDEYDAIAIALTHLACMKIKISTN